MIQILLNVWKEIISWFNKIDWINEIDKFNNNLLRRIEDGNKIEIFIGITSILIAIVIFVAETIDKDKYEINKKFILKHTHLKFTTIYAIMVMVFCILGDTIIYNGNSNDNIIMYFTIHILINVAILASITMTIRLIIVAIRLNTDSEYYHKLHTEFINKKIREINNECIRNVKKNKYDIPTENIVKEYSEYFTQEPINEENKSDYFEVKGYQSNIFRGYKSKEIQVIVEEIDKIVANQKEYNPKYKIPIVLPLNVGDIVNRSVTIAYCPKKFRDLEEYIRNSIARAVEYLYPDNQMDSMLRDLFNKANKSKNIFDEDNRLYNMCDYLYKNKMYTLINKFIEYAKNEATHYANDYNRNRKYVLFLKYIRRLAYAYNDYSNFKLLTDYMYYLYRQQLSLTKDIMQVTYDFVENMIRYDYYEAKNNTDTIYFDLVLSKLLIFIFDLLNAKQFDAIDIIFENVLLYPNNNYSLSDEHDDYDIARIQVSFGFIYGLIILNNKHRFNKNDKESLHKLIRNIKSNFVPIYDEVDAIRMFKKYYHYASNISDIYNAFDFYFEDKKYKNSWSGQCIDEIFIIKEYLYVFNIQYGNVDEIVKEEITKDDQFFYKRFLENVLSKKEISELDKLLEITFDNKKLIEILKEMVKISEADEKRFNRENSLSKENLNLFKEKLVERINEGNKLISYLRENNKIIITKDKSNDGFGISQVVGREIFFNNTYGIEMLSENYANAISSGLSRDYINKIDSIAEDKSIDEMYKVFKKTKEIEKYVIITGPLNYKQFEEYNYKNDTINIGNKTVKIINIPKVSDIYLIKQNCLPSIYMNEYRPDDLGKYDMIDSVFYQMIDCSKDEMTRKDIIKNVDWLKDEGTPEEQDYFLRGKCLLRIYIAPKIKKVNKSKCIRFKVQEGDDN